MTRQALPEAGRTIEVPVLNVHKLITYLDLDDKVTYVKFCPVCKMPEFKRSTIIDSIICVNCNSWYGPTDMHKIRYLNTAPYINLLKTLPLKYQGKLTPTLPFKEEENRVVTYNDLTDHFIFQLDKLV